MLVGKERGKAACLVPEKGASPLSLFGTSRLIKRALKGGGGKKDSYRGGGSAITSNGDGGRTFLWVTRAGSEEKKSYDSAGRREGRKEACACSKRKLISNLREKNQESKNRRIQRERRRRARKEGCQQKKQKPGEQRKRPTGMVVIGTGNGSS